jgi:hypothetical protein
VTGGERTRSQKVRPRSGVVSEESSVCLVVVCRKSCQLGVTKDSSSRPMGWVVSRIEPRWETSQIRLDTEGKNEVITKDTQGRYLR